MRKSARYFLLIRFVYPTCNQSKHTRTLPALRRIAIGPDTINQRAQLARSVRCGRFRTATWAQTVERPKPLQPESEAILRPQTNVATRGVRLRTSTLGTADWRVFRFRVAADERAPDRVGVSTRDTMALDSRSVQSPPNALIRAVEGLPTVGLARGTHPPGSTRMTYG